MRIKCDPKALPKPKLKPTVAVRVPDKMGNVAKFGAIPQKEFEAMMQRAKANRKDIWNDDEVRTLKDMCKQGYKVDEIALHIPNRTTKAVESKIRKMRSRGEL